MKNGFQDRRARKNLCSLKRWDVNQNGFGQPQKTWEKKSQTAIETQMAMPI